MRQSEDVVHETEQRAPAAGDVVAKYHHDHCYECGDELRQVVEVDLADRVERRTVCESELSQRFDERDEKERERKENPSGNCREPAHGGQAFPWSFFLR